MRLVILGGGESGTGAALLAKQKGIEVFISDIGTIKDDYKHLLKAYAIPFEEGHHTIEKIKEADQVIKSPGIPHETAVIQQLHVCRIPVIDEITFAAPYAKGKIIAITGSNGKSTTAHLIYHLLDAAGYHVALAGNMGYSFARCLAKGSYDYYVLELSSFQLESLKNFKPNIACLLNITPDHLNRYNYSVEAYAKAKLNILRNMTPLDHFIYNKSDPITAAYLQAQNILPELHPIDPLSIWNSDGLCYCNVDGTSFSISREQIALPGRHNQYNAIVAITAAALSGVAPTTIYGALPKFHGLSHRLEWCGAPKGIDCYNDSKSTNIASTRAALLSFNQPIIWMAGGVDKGNDYSLLLPILQERVKAIICLGKDNHAIIKDFAPLGLPIQETDNLDNAIHMALSIASPGEVILLSPACASFDLFKNFEDRGNQFKKKINKLIQKYPLPKI
ncbi:UDP-N-acetylmuramoyl-L-alanine--D-glutamate ligase [Cardinium endosymbiont of Bemisia tabaci]|uniref:UDP-N-acetylmuramoyl-L-alanine--D-glutamate ligase n=1 Tax=Cardinium endosymbiont of Bemisia tabaci TaxID=672794 RepID=UPI000442D310|nr:UDP-N-acetylmuramoyl-L-alanine--D-glutamate ligase [Cardinium endosymbiont of Bemisia tabaci]CDG50092.1 UDP-N-acetylmuramoylalanine--D-glutamate ligase [Cardinium endosymbiont cBtQ1 of Bemisia tabaci]